MIDCPYCSDCKDCKNDLLFHIIKDHEADMSEWPKPEKVGQAGASGDSTSGRCGDSQ